MCGMSRALTYSKSERSFSSSPKHTIPPGSSPGRRAASALPLPAFGACTSTTLRPSQALSRAPSSSGRSSASICSPVMSVFRKWMAVLAGLASSQAPGMRCSNRCASALNRSSASLCACRGSAMPLSPIRRTPEMGTSDSSCVAGRLLRTMTSARRVMSSCSTSRASALARAADGSGTISARVPSKSVTRTSSPGGTRDAGELSQTCVISSVS